MRNIGIRIQRYKLRRYRAPESIRIRKKILDHSRREVAAKRSAAQAS